MAGSFVSVVGRNFIEHVTHGHRNRPSYIVSRYKSTFTRPRRSRFTKSPEASLDMVERHSVAGFSRGDGRVGLDRAL